MYMRNIVFIYMAVLTVMMPLRCLPPFTNPNILSVSSFTKRKSQNDSPIIETKSKVRKSLEKIHNAARHRGSDLMCLLKPLCFLRNLFSIFNQRRFGPNNGSEQLQMQAHDKSCNSFYPRFNLFGLFYKNYIQVKERSQFHLFKLNRVAFYKKESNA